MKIITWNVRGAGSTTFRNHFLDICDIHQPAIVTVAETKIGGQAAANMCESLPFHGYEIVDSVGRKGGLWLLWNQNDVRVNIISKTEQEIHATVQVSSDTPSWLLSAVYASPNFSNRMILWDNLKFVASQNSLP